MVYDKLNGVIMAINPSNVTSVQITWLPTVEIRYVGKKRNKAALQQKWKHVSSGEEEWRDVEFVHTNDEGN